MKPAAIIEAELGFLPAAGVAEDTVRKDGVLRAPNDLTIEDICDKIIPHTCRIHDCAAEGIAQPQLDSHSFETVDLSSLTALQTTLEVVRKTGAMQPAQVKAIKRALLGQRLALADGRQARILFIAGEGLIIRKSGPNGLVVNPDEAVTATNGHVAAKAVHADQDVYGIPVRQLLLGLAPRLFRHESPNGCNHRSPLHLLNLWIPLQQLSRPLALMDQRSLNRRQHQLRYALPVDYFLDRHGKQKFNDIWGFLPDPAQQWYFRSGMDSHAAWLFNTLGCPHGSFIAPGEALAEQCYVQLAAARRAIEQGNIGALSLSSTVATADFPAGTSPSLAAAITEMLSLLKEAHSNSASRIGNGGKAWSYQASQAMDKVVRKSIEMRLVAWVS